MAQLRLIFIFLFTITQILQNVESLPFLDTRSPFEATYLAISPNEISSSDLGKKYKTIPPKTNFESWVDSLKDGVDTIKTGLSSTFNLENYNYVVHKLGFTSVTDKHMPKYMRKHQQHKHNYN